MIKLQVKGLETISREMEDLAAAAARLDGEIVKLNFDPRDPAAVTGAISQMEQAVDSRVGNLARSASVRNLAAATKKTYRHKIEELVHQASAS